MTAREPPQDLTASLLQNRLEDFEWALTRLIELVGQKDRALAIEVTARLADENQTRQAARMREANLSGR